MAVITAQNLAALTIAYNGVQFGGADSEYGSTPPQYSFRGEFVYDDSRRTVKYTRYTMNVRCVFLENTQALMEASMLQVQTLLAEPAKLLTIRGLGTAFNTIDYDLDGGPRPLDITCTPLSQIGFEVSWTVEFAVKRCGLGSISRSEMAFLAFNFDTSWQNDFEGLPTRTISGHVEIAHRRSGKGTKTYKHVVDEVRDSITIIVPIGYRRVTNVWRENQAKTRLDFMVVDEAQPGDYLPEGCTRADGEFTFESGTGAPGGGGFAQATATLTMSVRTAPDQPRSLAGNIFLQAAITKQVAMQSAMANRVGTVLPARLRVSAGKYDRARESNFSMSWILTKCLNDMMKAAGIWEPIVVPTQGNNYASWRASVAHLWNNRGWIAEGGQALRSNPNEAVIIDLCDNVRDMVIGDSPSAAPVTKEKFAYTFKCPTIPPDGGWIHHEIEVRILREDEQTWHKKPIPYNPSPGDGFQPFVTSPNDESDVEHHGQPVTYIGIYFRGLRFIDDPKQAHTKLVMPEVKSVAGLPTVPHTQNVIGPKWAFDTLTCPVFFLQGWKVYRVHGYVPEVKAQESLSSCAASDGDKEQY